MWILCANNYTFRFPLHLVKSLPACIYLDSLGKIQGMKQPQKLIRIITITNLQKIAQMSSPTDIAALTYLSFFRYSFNVYNAMQSHLGF